LNLHIVDECDQKKGGEILYTAGAGNSRIKRPTGQLQSPPSRISNNSSRQDKVVPPLAATLIPSRSDIPLTIHCSRFIDIKKIVQFGSCSHIGDPLLHGMPDLEAIPFIQIFYV